MKQDERTPGPWTIEGPERLREALPGSIRIPLHSLQADLDYLVGRIVADGSCAAAMSSSIRDRLNQIEAACYVSLEIKDLRGTDRQTSDDVGILREALAEGRQAAVELASLMREGAHHKKEIKWCKVVDKIDAALKGVPQPANEDYQADASAPALSEKFNGSDEQERKQRNTQTDLVDAVLYLNDIVGDLHETGMTSETRLEGLQKAVNRMLENIGSAHSPVSMTISNESERDAVGLNQPSKSESRSSLGEARISDAQGERRAKSQSEHQER